MTLGIHFSNSTPRGRTKSWRPLSPVYGSGVMSPKLVELLSIAFDASYTHMYAPGTRRHIKSALQLSAAALKKYMDVLKLCVAQGVQACNMGIPILEEELGRQTMGKRQISTARR